MRIRELAGAEDPLVPALFGLYHQEFDLPCRDPDEQVWHEITGSSRLPYRFHVAESEGKLAAFMRWVDLPETGASFVVHIATDPQWRGTGLARALLQIPPEELAILLEVERVQDAESAEDREVRRRRLDWFARQGARLVTPTYTQPALHATTKPVPLLLLAIRRERIADQRQYVESFYREVWERGVDDPLVHRAIVGVRT